MREMLPYRSWALPPVDTDPAATEPTTIYPPQMSNALVHKSASLQFEFAAPFADQQIRLRATSLSADDWESPGCRVLVPDRPAPLRELQVVEWEITVDGLDTYFVAKVTGNGSDRYAKLHCHSVAELVVSGAVFQA